MWSGTYSVGRATTPSGKSGKSRATTAIRRESTCATIARMIDAPPPRPPTVLVVSETAGFHHDSIPAQQAFLRSLRGLRVVVLERIAQLTAARLRTARAVVFASTSGQPSFSTTGRRAFLRWI